MNVDKELEKKIARYFAPTYFSSFREYQYLAELEHKLYPRVSLCHPPWNPYIYYSIYKWTPIDNHDFYEINYLSIWDKDTGIRGHVWDTERIALLVKAPMNETHILSFEVQEAYFAAHEGEGLFNRSKYVEHPKVAGGIAVYWSLNKHASYASLNDANQYWFIEAFKEPGTKADPNSYDLNDAGTIDQPYEPWIGYKEPWKPDDVSSVYSKLIHRIWSPIPGSSRWNRNLPGEEDAKWEIKKFQRALNLRATGKINKKLYDQIYTLPSEVIRNSSNMDQKIIAEVMRLQPKELDADQVATTFNVSIESLRTPKTIKESVDGVIGAETICLGQINSKTIIYGLIDPKNQKIFAIRKAPIKIIKENAIKSSNLRKP
jgi:hypothetical protein